MIKRQWYWNLRDARVFFMSGWKDARLGRLGICYVKTKRKKCSLKSTLCCLTPLFIWFLFGLGFGGFLVFFFLIFLPTKSNLGFSRLQKILCLVFSFVFLCFPFSFLYIYFSQNQFFPSLNLPFFGIDLLGFLRLFPPLLPFSAFFCFCVDGDCFLFQIQLHKRKTSTV